MTAVNPKWLLVDVYIDIASSKTGSSRKEFNRMLNDCKSSNIGIILSKNISRFGRDTVEVLEALNQLKVLGVPVIFDQEALNTADIDDELMISIIESITQAENKSRGDNIKYNVPIKQDKNFEKLNEPDIIKNSKLSGKKVHKNG
jgi:site-specific DNA recombinase